MLNHVQMETYFEFQLSSCLTNVILEEVLSTKWDTNAWLPLNMASINTKRQKQANEYNICRQDMNYEKKSANFIWFPPYTFVVYVEYETCYFLRFFFS